MKCKNLFMIVLLGLLGVLFGSVRVSALTQEEAVEWAYERVDKWVTGRYGQPLGGCNDLTWSYAWNNFGYSLPNYGVPDDFSSYANEMPDGWQKFFYTPGFVLEPGDIVYWKAGITSEGHRFGLGDENVGHTAIVVSVTTDQWLTIDQGSYADPYLGGPAQLYSQRVYDLVLGVLRPPFNGQPGPQLSFNSSSWAEAEMQRAIELRLIPGLIIGKDVTRSINRAEFSSLGVRLYETITKIELTERVQFDDNFSFDVEKLAALGVVLGTGNNKFDPDAYLTREQAATIIPRLAMAMNNPLPIYAATFGDNNNIAAWALEGVGQVQAARIMQGTGNNNFSPTASYTIEQSILTMLRLYDYCMSNGYN